jgi:hypothetical protein
MSAEILNYLVDKLLSMAATSRSQSMVDKVKSLSEIPIPCCSEYEKMISGLK